MINFKNVPTSSKIWKLKRLIRCCKLVPVSVDLSKLNNVVKNDVVKKDVYNAKIRNIEDNVPDINSLAANTTLNAKINEVIKEISTLQTWILLLLVILK